MTPNIVLQLLMTMIAAARSQVGRQAAEYLLVGLASGGCTDQWLQDQLVIFMALAQASTTTRDALPFLRAALQLTSAFVDCLCPHNLAYDLPLASSTWPLQVQCGDMHAQTHISRVRVAALACRDIPWSPAGSCRCIRELP